MMLCQFTVTNYRCFKEETTLDMQATDLVEHKESLLQDIDGEIFLPLAVIYGPNGSGKSTLLKSLFSLAYKIASPICAVDPDSVDCKGAGVGKTISPFLFSSKTMEEPTEFELFFRTKKYEYQYIVRILKDKVLKEELYRKPLKGKNYITLFLRDEKKIQLKYSLADYSCNGISDNLLLLSFLGITHGNNTIVRDAIDWFMTSLDFLNFADPWRERSVALAKSVRLKALVLKMIKELDLDIVDYRVEKKEEKLRIYTEHVINRKKYELNLLDESAGTIKIFGMLPNVADCLLYGRTLIVDELDSKLHPVLLRYIIGLFSNPDINRHKAQLIFTSHDLSTMNSECFRRDEIWFTAKGENQASKLYSLIEFKDDTDDADIDKEYLEGKYGADPYLERCINWGELNGIAEES